MKGRNRIDHDLMTVEAGCRVYVWAAYTTSISIILCKFENFHNLK